MLQFRRPIAKILLANSRRPRYEIKEGDEGWCLYDPLQEVAAKGELRSSWILPGDYLQFGNRALGAAITVDRQYLKGVMLRPIIPNSLQATLEAAFQTDPGGADWMVEASEDDEFIEFSQEDSEDGGGLPIASYVRYPFNCCSNVFFVAGFRRQTPTDEVLQDMEDTDWEDAEWSNIMFGGTAAAPRWCLHVPLKGTPLLFERWTYAGKPVGYLEWWPDGTNNCYWVHRPWTEGELQAVDPASMAREGVTYTIGGLGNALCVSENGFGENDNFAYYLVPNAEYAIPPGTIELNNWPGQVAYWLAFCEFQNANVYRLPVALDTIRTDDVHYFIWSRLPWGMAAFGGGTDVILEETPGYPGYLDYYLELQRYRYPQNVGDLDPDEMFTYTTPFVESVAVWQTPDLTDNGEPAFTEIDQDVYEASIAGELNSNTSQHLNMRVDNRMSTDAVAGAAGTPSTLEFRPGRLVKLEGGWNYDTELGIQEVTYNLGQYYIVAPERTSREGSFDLTDMLGRLALSEWDSGRLGLRGWNAASAIEFLLQLWGYGPAQYDIEDTGCILSSGLDPNNDSWTWEAGTSIQEILGAIAVAGGRNAAIWYDWADNKIKMGCPYCRAKRTALNWWQHQDNGWNSSGCRAVDIARVLAFSGHADGIDLVLAASPEVASDPSTMNFAENLTCRVEALSEGQYANRITVWGETLEGYAIGAMWKDRRTLYELPDGTLSDYYIGFPISHVEQDSTLHTMDAVNRRLVERVMELSTWPDIIEFDMPLNTALMNGHVVQIEGGKAMGIDQQLFRVQSIRHPFGRARSTVTARIMFDADVIVSSLSSSSSSSMSL